MTGRRALLALVAVPLLAISVARAVIWNQDRFNHPKHAKLFPVCSTCHEGATNANARMFPVTTDCARCHDGRIQPSLSFAPRTVMTPSNLRFTHERHATVAVRDTGLATRCQECHAERNAPRMEVRHAVIGNCLSCHRLPPDHLAVPDTACATCHVPLARVAHYTRADVARLPAPPSHRGADFALAGHAKFAAPAGAKGVSASCATCHAREFCASCHVNAPEVAPINALESDPRSTAIVTTMRTPESHRSPGFLSSHRKAAGAKGATCATCHTRESCEACHAAPAPGPVRALASAGPGRAIGAQVERKPPVTHTERFRENHRPEASASPATCMGCHVRTQCTECHRPDPSGGNPREAYHPAAFLTRHPSEAWSRQANCSDCHNPGQFCQTCHLQSGLTAGTHRLGARGYHDAIPNFSLGHGQAARQNLESCASCHAERDCTACHSSVSGGFGFSPHGPGFNSERLLKKNPSLCVACHGTSIPRR